MRKIKQKYNYKEIVSKENNPKFQKLISLDVARISVNDKNRENEIKDTLKRILNALTKIDTKIKDIKYYQGMHYIAQLLMEIYGEEESFYLFLSFFLNTEYFMVFEKELHRLKVFFYVFKRILSLYEPEICAYLSANNLEINFFLPQWFVTLFSGAHHYLRDKEDNSEMMIRVFDHFILYGWKAMMSIGCAFLHLYEKVLMNLEYEGLMRFLLNDILKSDFFLNNNINEIDKAMVEFKISKKLILNIEAEYEQNAIFEKEKEKIEIHKEEEKEV